MQIHRSYSKTIYPDGRVQVFDPWITWLLWDNGIGEIGLRNGWSLGYLWRWKVGNWSRYKTWYVQIGWLTIYAHCGITDPPGKYKGLVFRNNKIEFRDGSR